ncbi:hypothetical protein CDAR_3401 [Caerostris darwini]|uniref:Uncharacterized protein n=1 Tax=Caerostris darwini TaxID=1538125 RepID=A0AAV4QXA1_9ARAC|nr:hypothetical protein CDAR_3401 [Caerostris darwini]
MPLDHRSGWTQERACHPMMGGTLPAHLNDHLSVTLSEGYKFHFLLHPRIRRANEAAQIVCFQPAPYRMRTQVQVQKIRLLPDSSLNRLFAEMVWKAHYSWYGVMESNKTRRKGFIKTICSEGDEGLTSYYTPAFAGANEAAQIVCVQPAPYRMRTQVQVQRIRLLPDSLLNSCLRRWFGRLIILSAVAAVMESNKTWGGGWEGSIKAICSEGDEG